jgi:hypothetical protein
MPDNPKSGDRSTAASQASSKDGATPASGAGLASAPAFAMAALYQSYAHSTGLLYENAVQAQQQTACVAQAATLLGVLGIFGVMPGAPAAGGGGAAKSGSGNAAA